MFCFTKQQLDYLAKQVSDIISTDNISNLRTNEDLSLVREDNISTLSFADRDTSKGLAYKILRTESTFAEQVTDEDTIYEIRYDFALSDTTFVDAHEECSIDGMLYYHNSEAIPVNAGESIAVPSNGYILNSDLTSVLSSGGSYTPAADTEVFVALRTYGETSYYTPGTVILPEDCVLRFNGGKLYNGTIVGNGAVLDSAPVQIFDSVILKGFNLDKIDIRWFGAKEGEDIADVMDVVMKTYNQHIGVPIKMIGHYRLSRTIRCASGIVIWNDFMVPDLFSDRVHTGHELKPLGWLEVAAGVTAFHCQRTSLRADGKIPRGSTAFRGIKFTAEAQFDDEENPTVLLLQRIAGLPPRGFKIEDCQFENFDKAIMLDRAFGDYGSIISQFLIDNCTFTSDDGYALWVENLNQDAGNLTINGLEMVRCTLSRTKMHLVGIYGVNKIAEIVINGVSNSSPLVDPVDIRMKYGTLELDQWYMEYLSGAFSITGESGFSSGSGNNEYDLQTVVRVSNWYTMHSGYKSDNNHPKLIFKDVSVQAVPDLFPKRNIIFNNASVDPGVIEGRTFGPVDMYSLLPESGANYNETAGIYYGSMVVKTEKFRTLPSTAARSYNVVESGNSVRKREPVFRGIFSDSNGTMISYSKLNNLYARNHSGSGPVDYSMSSYVTNGPFDNENVYLLTFYKDINRMIITFKDVDGNAIMTVPLPYSPGVALVMLKGNLTQIKSLSISRAGVGVSTNITTSYIGIQRLIMVDYYESGGETVRVETAYPSAYQALSQFIVLINNNGRPAGLTSGRPAAEYVDIGFEYFDTTLGKPIYVASVTEDEHNPGKFTASWVDATGASV